MPDENLKERIQQIEELVRQTEALSDPKAHALAVELLQAVLGFHAAGLERLIEIIAERGETGRAILAAMTADDLASSMLLLHNLHPDSFDVRVERALEKVRHGLRARGVTVALLGIDDGIVRVRAEGGRSHGAAAVQATIEETIYSMAPDAAGVVVDGLEQPAASGFVPLASLYAG